MKKPNVRASKSKPMDPGRRIPRYIHERLTAEYNGEVVKLTGDDGLFITDEIELDAEALGNLLEYVKDIGVVK